MNRTDYRQYRFSPIKNEAELREAIAYVHQVCHQLCRQTFGCYLPTRGNIGIFAHYYDEFEHLVALRKRLTDPGAHYKNKYFRLHQPISVPQRGDVPGATYEFLYIRRVDPYRSQVGDVDFILPGYEHEALKLTLNTETFTQGARLFGRPEENIIELWNPDIDALAYLATAPMKPEDPVN